MQLVPPVFRPPSEARSLILQATLGCSWNRCTYCDMYRAKPFVARSLPAVLADVREAARRWGPTVRRVFVADGDPLVLPTDHWLALLGALREAFPALERVSTYATAGNVLGKSEDELRALREAGLALLYIGPESGDPVVLKRIAKGATFEDHVEAARRAHAAGMAVSAIFLLGAGGVERSREHAEGSARLATAMDPEYLAALTLTVIPGTPIHRLAERGRFELPDTDGLLSELATLVRLARPTDALFRTNHASNHLPIGGRLPRDRDHILALIEAARAGLLPLRPEHARGL